MADTVVEKILGWRKADVNGVWMWFDKNGNVSCSCSNFKPTESLHDADVIKVEMAGRGYLFSMFDSKEHGAIAKFEKGDPCIPPKIDPAAWRVRVKPAEAVCLAALLAAERDGW